MQAAISRHAMNLYRIASWAVGYTKYPWVAGWGPLEYMPFFSTFPPITQKSKIEFWDVNPRLPGLHIDPGGKVWADVLGCGGGPPSFFVSERIINNLQAEGIPILRATEMPIAKNLSKALKDVPSPKYYVLEAAPGIRLAYEAMGIELDSTGKPILVQGAKFPEAIYDLATWNGADLMGKLAVYDSTTSLLCTERVKELAERNGWTNIEFKPVKVV
jgi:hypothetical protein